MYLKLNIKDIIWVCSVISLWHRLFLLFLPGYHSFTRPTVECWEKDTFICSCNCKPIISTTCPRIDRRLSEIILVWWLQLCKPEPSHNWVWRMRSCDNKWNDFQESLRIAFGKVRNDWSGGTPFSIPSWFFSPHSQDLNPKDPLQRAKGISACIWSTMSIKSSSSKSSLSVRFLSCMPANGLWPSWEGYKCL